MNFICTEKQYDYIRTVDEQKMTTIQRFVTTRLTYEYKSTINIIMINIFNIEVA